MHHDWTRSFMGNSSMGSLFRTRQLRFLHHLARHICFKMCSGLECKNTTIIWHESLSRPLSPLFFTSVWLSRRIWMIPYDLKFCDISALLYKTTELYSVLPLVKF
ncbi:hypothetical protein BT69DRAFT_1350364, partial [Atractiella rhizophila]